MKGQQLFRICALLVLCSSSSAWPWPPFDGLLIRRQDAENSSAEPSPESTPSATASRTRATSAEETTATATATGSNSNSPSRTESASGTDGSDSESTTDSESSPTPTNEDDDDESNDDDNGDDEESGDEESSSTIEIDPRLPAGGVQMVTPAPISGSQYYKIGDYVTFAWNYTSLSVTPKAIDVVASCSLNNQLYTIAVNQTVQDAQAVVWDTGAERTNSAPLPMATYTLIIYDSEQGVSATPSSGFLGAFNQLRFGMYAPRPYTPLASYKCASCNGASSSLDRHALGFLLGMATITCLSFTWFLTGVARW